MTQKEEQFDDQPSVIVLAPETWRQQIQIVLKNAQVHLRFSMQEKSGIVSRLKQLQAEQALNLAAEATHITDANNGVAIVITEDISRVLFTLALHHNEQTELHLWTFDSSQEALAFLVSTVSQLLSKDSLISSSKQHVTSRQDLFHDHQSDQRIWTLNEDKQFISSTTTGKTGILSGSFNPLHFGHQRMREAAMEILESEVVYEMTLRNADKPPLDYLSLSARAAQFSAGELLLTAAPTFREKAELMPGSTFVIGWDTAVRVLDDRFYGAGQLASALEEFATRECAFLVASRRERGSLRRLRDLSIPDRFRDLFTEIPTELFEEDISSTSLREAWLRGESNIGPPLCMMVESHTP